MFAIAAVNDFKVELLTVADREILKVSIEVKRDAVAETIAAHIAEDVRRVFEVRPDVAVMPIGTLAKEFESSVKVPRFADKRS